MEEAKGTFEDQWSQRFNEAEATPPPAVWMAIDAHLANQGMAGYKKEATIYRWVAAACLLLLTMVGLYTFNGSTETGSEIASNAPIKTAEQKEDAINQITNKETTTEIEKNASATLQTNKSLKKEAGDFKAKENNSADFIVDNSVVQNSLETSTTESPLANEAKGDAKFKINEVNSSDIVALGTVTKNKAETNTSENQLIANEALAVADFNDAKTNTRSLELTLPMDFQALAKKELDQSTQTEKWEVDHLYGVATPHLYQKDASMSQLWAGVSMGAGSFDPQFGGTGSAGLNTNALSNVSPSAKEDNQSTYAAGNSVSGGINLGGRIDQHFVLSGGIHYSAFSTGSADRLVATDLTTNRSFALAESNNSGLTADAIDSKSDYALNGDVASLNNQFRYLTVPLKAGYIVLDKQFNITLNSGLSSNFLIDARLNQTGGSSELSDDLETSQNYKSVYFNFISSVEFGYTLQKKYRVSVEPTYNQALSSFTNSNNLYTGKPKNFGLSVGLRYNF